MPSEWGELRAAEFKTKQQHFEFCCSWIALFKRQKGKNFKIYSIILYPNSIYTLVKSAVSWCCHNPCFGSFETWSILFVGARKTQITNYLAIWKLLLVTSKGFEFSSLISRVGDSFQRESGFQKYLYILLLNTFIIVFPLLCLENQNYPITNILKRESKFKIQWQNYAINFWNPDSDLFNLRPSGHWKIQNSHAWSSVSLIFDKKKTYYYYISTFPGLWLLIIVLDVHICNTLLSTMQNSFALKKIFQQLFVMHLTREKTLATQKIVLCNEKCSVFNVVVNFFCESLREVQMHKSSHNHISIWFMI